jgi:hypothetical protein
MKTDKDKTNGKIKGGIAKIKAIVPPVPKRFKKQNIQDQTEEALQNVPRITNETVAEHREEILRGARKYMYPLEHSKHKIVIITSALILLALITFFITSAVELYKVQSTSKVTYRITQVIPFPVAKAGKHFILYENYLFELRRYMYYYQSQQQVDFSSDSGKRQLVAYKPKAMERVIQDAYVKELAEKHGIRVSNSEVADAVALLRAQNMLQTNKDLESVTRRFYGWSISDLERELKQELLAQKVAAALDTDAIKRADDVLKQAQNGGDFSKLASQYSDDTSTKNSGGVYADTAISTGNQTVSPVIVRELPKMKPGEVSRIITTPTAFEIIKLLEVSQDNKYKVAHIQIAFKPITTFTKPISDTTKVHHFIQIDLDAKPAETP